MVTEVSFKIGGPAKPVVLVPTFVNGEGPYDFALDTGASLAVLSTELAGRLGIQKGDSRSGIGAGGRVAASVSNVQSIALGQARVVNLQVAIVDLSALSQAAGVRLEGILGYNFLKSFRVTIDYPNQTLRLESA